MATPTSGGSGTGCVTPRCASRGLLAWDTREDLLGIAKKGGSLARVAVAGSDSPWSPGSLHHTRPERYGVLLSLNENCRGERSLLVVYLLLWAIRRVVAG